MTGMFQKLLKKCQHWTSKIALFLNLRLLKRPNIEIHNRTKSGANIGPIVKYAKSSWALEKKSAAVVKKIILKDYITKIIINPVRKYYQEKYH